MKTLKRAILVGVRGGRLVLGGAKVQSFFPIRHRGLSRSRPDRANYGMFRAKSTCVSIKSLGKSHQISNAGMQGGAKVVKNGVLRVRLAHRQIGRGGGRERLRNAYLDPMRFRVMGTRVSPVLDVLAHYGFAECEGEDQDLKFTYPSLGVVGSLGGDGLVRFRPPWRLRGDGLTLETLRAYVHALHEVRRHGVIYALDLSEDDRSKGMR